jgi:hypothetical protein
VANVKYSDLLDEVLPNLAADPSDPVTEHAIKRAAIQFCEGSWVWKHLPDPLDVEAGEAAYTIEIPSGSDVAAVIGVEYDGQPIDQKSVDWLNANHPGWRTQTGTPKYFTQVDTEQIILAPVPESTLTGALVLTLALAPSQSSTGFPKWISNQYIYAIADGALAKLMTMPNKGWTDVPTGLDRRVSFDAAVAGARATAVTALGRAPLRVKGQH